MIVVAFVFKESIPAIRGIGLSRLFTDQSWHPTANQFNFLPMIVGSLAITMGAFLVTAPLGVGSAVFANFYAPPRIGFIYRRCLELLAAVPSVVFGLWGLCQIVPLVGEVSPLGLGQSLLAGIIVLSTMTLPVIAVAADTAIRAEKEKHELTALALGMNRRALAWSIVVPAAKRGIMTGMVLQVSRALGETMAVLMVCGNIVRFPTSVFQPIRTLTSNVAMEMGYAGETHRSVLFASGLVLLVTIGAVLAVGHWFRKASSA